jgi:hypothetical protein
MGFLFKAGGNSGKAKKLINELATTSGCTGKINNPATGEVPTFKCKQLIS